MKLLYLPLTALILLQSASGYCFISRNKYMAYGGGSLIARPLKNTNRGILFDTLEFELNYGGFSDSSKYIGTTCHMSSESQKVFDLFTKLDASQDYVFEYVNKNPFNPEIEDSHMQIIDVYPLKSHEAFKAAKLPMSVTSNGAGRQGWMSNGTGGGRKGRIIDVERRGMIDSDCIVTLNLGGMTRGLNGMEENVIDFNVYDDALCAYAEQLLPYGVDVNVEYTQDMFEMWDYSVYIAHKISVTGFRNTTNEDESRSRAAAIINDKTLKELKEALLSDQMFIRDLRSKLDSPNALN